MERKFGVLLPVFSLYGEYGIGTFGKPAYEFVDFLADCGVSFWQVLPLCPVGHGASPYSSPCGDAINPYFIDLDVLIQKGLLTEAECEHCKCKNSLRVDYNALDSRIDLLKKAFGRFSGEVSGYTEYALFMALKEAHGGSPWYEWGECSDYKSETVQEFYKANIDNVRFWQFVQDEALGEWLALKNYANGKGVEIIGDMPFYVAYDSVDVWLNKSLFKCDGYIPSVVAGVPPDYFSVTGQLWGNPVYVWHNQCYVWWNKRIQGALKLFDRLRLDHFRAFDEYYEIPYGSEDATNGVWQKGPGFNFFKDKKGLPIIAEDLGIITDSVRKLLAQTWYPGMRVVQFGFDGNPNNPHLPSNITNNCVCYTGTHDNMPLKQFFTTLGENEYNVVKKILSDECGCALSDDIDELIDTVIELGCSTDARLFIVPLIDLMHSGDRINEPGAVSELNWSIRIKDDFDGLKEYISMLIKKYNR
ncbi:MAG: 4-alpha-glucanotransferase [Clostridiales bacterium]|nr:4-alpha-glucanotransferase [Clostridiales bacterium]